MPATQQGQIDGKPGKYRLRWYDNDGKRHTKQPFATKSAARAHYRDKVEPVLAPVPNGTRPVARDLTLSEFVPLFRERHAATGLRPRTISSLVERVARAEKVFGTVPLRELEGMVDELAGWQATLPERSRYGIVGAMRQVLGAAVRRGYIGRNPMALAGRNRQPAPRSVRVYTHAELDALGAEMSAQYQSLPQFVAATGLRPEEWQALERRDIDRVAGVLNVRRTVSSGEVVELGKTSRSRRQVPLSPRALAALDAMPPRIDTPVVFPAPEGGVLRLDNFRHREWTPAVESAGVASPARIYDLRHTFASNALAASVSIFELAKIMGTSALMIERVYGTLLDGAAKGIAARLGAWEAVTEQQAQMEQT